MATDLHRSFDAACWMASGRPAGKRPEYLPETYGTAGWRVCFQATTSLHEEVPAW